MRRTAWFLALALAACATTRPEPKMGFGEVFPAPEQLLPNLPKVKVEPPAPVISLELQAALMSFTTRARKFRSQAHRGGMSADEVANWSALIDEIDTFLARRARETSSYDVIRARITLEAELEQDVRSYASLPDELAAGIEERCARLAVRMAQLRRLKVTPRVQQPQFLWPVWPVAVTSLFGNRLHPITHTYRPHLGLDLAAEYGQQVFAAAAGAVILAERSEGHGNHVELLHPGNVVTGYSHLSEILVDVGQVVKQGEAIGLAGSTGASTGVHLHFELWRDGRACDPLEELGDPAERGQDRVAAR